MSHAVTIEDTAKIRRCRRRLLAQARAAGALALEAIDSGDPINACGFAAEAWSAALTAAACLDRLRDLRQSGGIA